MKSSILKKTISVAAFLAASNSALANKPTTFDEALDQLTGPNQATSGPEEELCLAVTPYFITSMTGPGEFVSSYHSLLVNGVSPFAKDEQGDCASPDRVTGLCERGFIKIKTTANLGCHVPVGL